jgi:hypothetical protein
MSAGPSGQLAGSPEPGLSVRVRFALADERGARALAAKLIDCAHELANLPESECDVDVEVQWTAPASVAAALPAAEPGRPDSRH